MTEVTVGDAGSLACVMVADDVADDMVDLDC